VITLFYMLILYLAYYMCYIYVKKIGTKKGVGKSGHPASNFKKFKRY